MAARYGSMMLSRAARPAFASPLAFRPFSTSIAFHQDNSKPSPRMNPIVGNSTPPTTTEAPQSSQPPSPETPPTSSAQVAPNTATPPPRPPPASNMDDTPTDPIKAKLKPSTSGSRSAKPYDIHIDEIISNAGLNYARGLQTNSDPMKLPLVRTAAVTGRTVFVMTPGQRMERGQAKSPEEAFSRLRVVGSQNGLKRLHHRQRFHERPGMKRKRLVMERWRKRFKNGFQATAHRVCELKKQGW